MAAYRASVHETTQFTPNRLIFGRENRMPADVVLGDLDTSEAELPSCMDEYAANIIERQRADYALVREHLGESAIRRKEQYDIRVRPKEFVPGQLVWYHYPRKRQGLSPKWQMYYTGPYRIVRLIDSHTIVIQKNARSKCIVVHRDKLKHCATDEEIANPPSSSRHESDSVREKRSPVISTRDDNDVSNDEFPGRVERPRRAVRKPAYLNDYCVRTVCLSRRERSTEAVRRQ
jgi:hypothetical protein